MDREAEVMGYTRLEAGLTSNDCACGGNVWDDVFHHPLSKTIRHALDAILGGALACLIQQPLDVLRVVAVEFVVGPLLRPQHNLGVWRRGSRW